MRVLGLGWARWWEEFRVWMTRWTTDSKQASHRKAMGNQSSVAEMASREAE